MDQPCHVALGIGAYGQLAGHRGWVQKGDVPPPAKGGSIWHC